MDALSCPMFERHRFRRYLGTCKRCGYPWRSHCHVEPFAKVEAWRKRKHWGHVSWMQPGVVFRGLGHLWDTLPYDVLVMILEWLPSWDLAHLCGVNRSWYLLVSSVDICWEKMVISFPWTTLDASANSLQNACCPRGLFVAKVMDSKEIMVLERIVRQECEAGFGAIGSRDLLNLAKFNTCLGSVRLLREAVLSSSATVNETALDAQAALREWKAIQSSHVGEVGAGSLQRRLKEAEARVAAAPKAKQEVEDLIAEFEVLGLEYVISENRARARKLFEKKPWLALSDLATRLKQAHAAVLTLGDAHASLSKNMSDRQVELSAQVEGLLEPQKSIARTLQSRETDPLLTSQTARVHVLERESQEFVEKLPQAMAGGAFLAGAWAFLKGGSVAWLITLSFLLVFIFARRIGHAISQVRVNAQRSVVEKTRNALEIPRLMSELDALRTETRSREMELRETHATLTKELRQSIERASRALAEAQQSQHMLQQEMDAALLECAAPFQTVEAVMARAREIRDRVGSISAIPVARESIGLKEAGGRLVAAFLTLGLTYFGERAQIHEWKSRVRAAVARDREIRSSKSL